MDVNNIYFEFFQKLAMQTFNAEGKELSMLPLKVRYSNIPVKLWDF